MYATCITLPYMFEHPAGTCFATWKHNWSIRQYTLLLRSKPVCDKVDLVAPMESEGAHVFCIVVNFVVTNSTSFGISFCIHEMQFLKNWNYAMQLIVFAALYLHSFLKQSGFYIYFWCIWIYDYNDREKGKTAMDIFLQAGLQCQTEYFQKFLAVVSHLSNEEHSTKCSKSIH